MKTRANNKTVTHRDRLALPVLVPVKLTQEELAQGKYAGTANFLRRFDPVTVVGQTPKYLVGELQLWHSHEKGDVYLSKKALGTIFSSAPRIAEVWQLPPNDRQAQFILPGEFTDNMKSARLVLWWDWRAKKLRPAVYCPNEKTALYVMAALGDLRACPCCDKLFIPERPDQEYCDIPCRERFRQQRRRGKLKGGTA